MMNMHRDTYSFTAWRLIVLVFLFASCWVIATQGGVTDSSSVHDAQAVNVHSLELKAAGTSFEPVSKVPRNRRLTGKQLSREVHLNRQQAGTEGDVRNPRTLKKIVGGEAAPEGRFPYIAGLLFQEQGSGAVPVCSGTLIAPNVVLSAAHCSGAVQVTVGCYLSTSTPLDEPNCEVFNVSEEHIFFDFSENVIGVRSNDFMLLVLSGLSNNPSIALLPDETFDLAPNDPFLVLGWGSLFFTGPQAEELQQVEVDYLTNADCQRRYELIAGVEIEINMLCGFRIDQDACQGDSGSPTLLTCEETGEDLVFGIVSFGVGCATPLYPGIYARVSAAISFIRHVVSKQGFSVKTVSSVDDFCVLGGTKAPTPETPPPTPRQTFPEDEWLCGVGTYGTMDACDCGCGAPDPDCDVDFFLDLIGCAPGFTCDEGVCVIPSEEITSFPTQSAVSAPSAWLCNPDFFFDILCDCECGDVDPACDTQPPVNCAGVNPQCNDGECFVPITSPPASWECSSFLFGSGNGCDCDCGDIDPDCSDDFNQLVDGCPGETDHCLDGVCIDGPPDEWTCSKSYYNTDDGCDCDCGAEDPDCSLTNSSEDVFNCPQPSECVEASCIFVPTPSPTKNPTTSPTPPTIPLPTTSPTKNPTRIPTISPTRNPTTTPSLSPTKLPTITPTGAPTIVPTVSSSTGDSLIIYIAAGSGGGLFMLLAIGFLFCKCKSKPIPPTIEAKVGVLDPVDAEAMEAKRAI